MTGESMIPVLFDQEDAPADDDRARFGISDMEIVDLARAFRLYGLFRIDLDSGHFFATADVFRLLAMPFTDGPVNMVELGARIHPDDFPLLMECFERVASEGGTFHLIYRVRSEGGYKFVRTVGRFRQKAGSSGEVYGITYEFFERLRTIGFVPPAAE